jgi:hypothetical protein
MSRSHSSTHPAAWPSRPSLALVVQRRTCVCVGGGGGAGPGFAGNSLVYEVGWGSQRCNRSRNDAKKRWELVGGRMRTRFTRVGQLVHDEVSVKHGV